MNRSLRWSLLVILVLGSINLPARAGSQEVPVVAGTAETTSSLLLTVEVGDLKDQLEKNTYYPHGQHNCHHNLVHLLDKRSHL